MRTMTRTRTLEDFSWLLLIAKSPSSQVPPASTASTASSSQPYSQLWPPSGPATHWPAGSLGNCGLRLVSCVFNNASSHVCTSTSASVLAKKGVARAQMLSHQFCLFFAKINYMKIMTGLSGEIDNIDRYREELFY